MANNLVILRSGVFQAVAPDGQYLKIEQSWKTLNKGTLQVNEDGTMTGKFGYGIDSTETIIAIPGDLHPTHKPWKMEDVKIEHNDMLDLLELEHSIP